MPKFLTQDELYRILQRELPEDVYADGEPASRFTTADQYAVAKTLESAYTNQQQVYLNQFPGSVDETGIAEFESTYFGVPSQGGLTLEQRQNRVIAKLRERRDLSIWSILTSILVGYSSRTTIEQVNPWVGSEWVLGVSKLGLETKLGEIKSVLVTADAGFVPEGTPVQLADVALQGWELGVSRLGLETYLSIRIRHPSELPDDFDWDDIPDNPLWNSQRYQAFTYEIRIFGYTLTTPERRMLDQFLTKIEPARSTHIILDGLNLEDYGLIYTRRNIDRFSLETCLFTDESSLTGFSARSTDA